MERVVGEVHGRRFAVEGPPALLRELVVRLPVGWRPTDRAAERVWRFMPGQPVRAEVDHHTLSDGEAAVAVEAVAQHLELWAAENARSTIFVHAGCVVVGGKALVLPGRSRAGKSTLVAALVLAGARYYSDEYAPIGVDGRVLPYHRPPVQRADSPASLWPVPPDDTEERPPVPVGLIAVLEFRPNMDQTAVERMSPGSAVMALLENTVGADRRATEAVQVLTRTIRSAVAVGGIRGEAEAAAAELITMLTRDPAERVHRTLRTE